MTSLTTSSSRRFFLGFVTLTLAALAGDDAAAKSAKLAKAAKPLRALLVLGGCCHDYARQKDILKDGIEKRANVQVTIVHSEDKTTKCRFEMYEKADWSKGYDVVIHDECSSDVKEMPYVQNVLGAHRSKGKGKPGVPAVNLHCAMHSYRTGTDDWFKFIGIQSTGHGPQEPIALSFVDKSHAVSQGLTDWTTDKEELYNNVKLFETSKPLVRGKQLQKKKDGSEKEEDFVVAWTNDYDGTRVFNTTIGHNNSTVSDDRYLELVTRGVLWATGKLDDSGKPKAGFGPGAAPAATK